MTLTTFTPENLIAGDYPLVSEPETIAADQVLKRGALLGRNTATKKLHLSVAAAEDGTEKPVAVLVSAMDTTGADAEGPVYKTGIFHFSGLEVGAGWDKASLRAALDNSPLFAV
ncbi:head decoration protein [Thalassospira marina]|uniref:Head decoration protein n=1 Tax=Thalassospira marina TaxID=2048283 RepID=A0A2N3KJQ5_9PROT|nr:head decoration protein [Thalassospira marina]PKR50775.1 head decoration protein [Thalassospira marina]